MASGNGGPVLGSGEQIFGADKQVCGLKVFDGDGFRTKIALRQLTGNPNDPLEVDAIRFGFIDAPELEQRGGREARDFLTALIGGRNVWIDILLKMDTGKSVDRYGRVVAVAYLGDRYLFSNRSLYLTRNIEIEMLLNGWAWVLERYGPDEIYFEALEVAQRNKRGEFGRGRIMFILGTLRVRNIMIAVHPQKNQKPLKNVQRKAVLEAW
jgi:endonuclease YncB( thermonuclease family)